MELNRDWGHSLNALTVQRGLQELNSDISFDPVVNRPSDNSYVLEMPREARDCIERGRCPICHNGRYIVAMDRNVIPEFKVWTMKDAEDLATFGEADKDDARVKYLGIPKEHPEYQDLYDAAKKGSRNDLRILSNGTLVRCWVTAPRKVRDRVVMVGWRHTFERLIMAKIPGVTRESLAAKFSVDMWKMPVGGPEETWAMLVEE